MLESGLPTYVCALLGVLFFCASFWIFIGAIVPTMSRQVRLVWLLRALVVFLLPSISHPIFFFPLLTCEELGANALHGGGRVLLLR